MTRAYAAQVTVLALAAALLLAATQVARPEHWSLPALYAYWVTRVMIEAGLFVAFAELFARMTPLGSRGWLVIALAAAVSLVPFVLSVTALDLILGLPELEGALEIAGASGGPAENTSAARPRIASFLRELVYLADNHLALCLLLSVPRIFAPAPAAFTAHGHERSDAPAIARQERPEASGETEPDHKPAASGSSSPDSDVVASQNTGKGYLRHLEQPLEAPLTRVEAQEHYVRLICGPESRMILYRFNDIIAELPKDLGMQVHRSHWVAFEAADSLSSDGGRLWLTVSDGTRIPVSRKHAEEVRSAFGSWLRKAKKAVT